MNIMANQEPPFLAVDAAKAPDYKGRDPKQGWTARIFRATLIGGSF